MVQSLRIGIIYQIYCFSCRFCFVFLRRLLGLTCLGRAGLGRARLVKQRDHATTSAIKSGVWGQVGVERAKGATFCRRVTMNRERRAALAHPGEDRESFISLIPPVMPTQTNTPNPQLFSFLLPFSKGSLPPHPQQSLDSLKGHKRNWS